MRKIPLFITHNGMSVEKGWDEVVKICMTHSYPIKEKDFYVGEKGEEAFIPYNDTWIQDGALWELNHEMRSVSKIKM